MTLKLTVQGFGHEDVLARLVEDGVASKLAAKDPTLWGPDAESEASIRLGWVDLPRTSRPLLAEVEALRAELLAEGVDHVVLAGMGGSSLAPEVITRTAGVSLTVLDSTDPGVIQRSLATHLERSVLVVSSKSGTTVETDSQRRAYLAAFEAAGIDGPSRIVVVTDPGSPLAELGEKEGYRKVFLADPNVGGRYSALTAFGLVPSGLAGADIAELLDDAEAVLDSFAADSPDNPALRLGAILGGAHNAGRDKVVLGDGPGSIVGFAAWAEQLIAESTGKQGKGLLPVDVGGSSATTPGWADAGMDATLAAIGRPEHVVTKLKQETFTWEGPGTVVTDGTLGALMLLWEYAVAIAGRVIGIDPFDQPDVEEAKKQARALLDNPTGGDGLSQSFVEGAVEVYGSSATSLEELFGSLGSLVPEHGYLALQAYLDRDADVDAASLRALVARASGLQTTFGWGPRFLHSTGQYHKGGHPNGGFVQLTGEVESDLAIPDRPYTFGQLQKAQAAGDARVLAEGRGRPVVRLHLTDRKAGLTQLLAAAESATQKG